jgi:hypothetical protein
MASSSKSIQIETTDELVAFALSVEGPQLQSTLVPVWRKLQKTGTSKGLTMAQLLTSPLSDHSDPLDALSKGDAQGKLGLAYANFL